ncbi:MAG: RNA-binding transcriptional accessory protein [Gammaproteobacteria bacterium]|nr:RNA-binding transcriptional accessory protein [Gammaproteobacteria bacterium]
MNQIYKIIATELSAQGQQVQAAIALLDEGATVPFIARYRKEVTGGLDDTQLRRLEERLRYLRDLQQRRESILGSIAEQGKLSSELEQAIHAAQTKTELEDLYLPYKKKRRTKAQIAREAGLAPLAKALMENPEQIPDQLAGIYIDADRGIEDSKAALDGARQILMEEFAEDARLVGGLREQLWRQGLVSSKVISGKELKGEKFGDYFNYAEKIAELPSHRALALLRGRNEGVLTLKLDVETKEDARHPFETRIAKHFGIENRGRAADDWLQGSVQWTWKIKLHTRLELDLMNQLRSAAEEEAIKVFSRNLHDLLLAAPAGHRITMGLDPGLRTGVKLAVVDGTGKLLTTATIYPHQPHKRWDESIKALINIVREHGVELTSIGNGTASRETDRLMSELIRRYPELRLRKLVISEAGASVYSASELASKEFPELDVSLRGAVSIARRLQDPLAELVKIEPRSIGVGQYQHDVGQSRLSRSLAAVVEDCVNAVGVDVNTASEPLLSRVSGFNQGLAGNLVEYRNKNGAFTNRKQFLKVSRLGPKAFEQAAGFLRIPNADNPLDASAVHPEAYPVVERIAECTGRDIRSLLGDRRFIKTLQPKDFTDEHFGAPTVTDIMAELEKPGRDPRPEFKTATFMEGVETLGDLHPGMILEGVVTNVTNFGAFVDVGVHQDGLVHISAMARKFVKDPREIVKTGDLVKVKVMDIDLKRKRIALSMRLSDDSREVPSTRKDFRTKPKQPPAKQQQTNRNNAMAEALRKMMKG